MSTGIGDLPRERISQKESAVADKLVPATLMDLGQILQDYGDRVEIIYAMAVAARHVGRVSSDGPILNWTVEMAKIGFLIGLLDHSHGLLICEEDASMWEDRVGAVYVEIVAQLIALQSGLFAIQGGGALRHLISFLGEHEPLEGISNRVRGFLREVGAGYLLGGGRVVESSPLVLTKPAPEDWKVLAKASLNYKMFAELQILVEWHTYDILPVLFEEVREQMGCSYAVADLLVCFNWNSDERVGEAFRRVGNDTRALRLLLDLAQEYEDEHGKPFPSSSLLPSS